MVEAGEVEHSALLKTRNLLIFPGAQSADSSKNARNWSITGTSPFVLSIARVRRIQMAKAARAVKVRKRFSEIGVSNSVCGHSSLRILKESHREARILSNLTHADSK